MPIAQFVVSAALLGVLVMLHIVSFVSHIVPFGLRNISVSLRGVLK